MKGYIIAIAALIFSVSLSAQDQVQAFRYSQVYPVGTARYAAMGGALGAVGGDITSASTNPAGLGLFRSSELTITPSFNINNSVSSYLGNDLKDSEYNFNIANLGIVTAFDHKRDEGLVSSVFAFGYNTLNNFHSNTTISGEGLEHSLLDNFALYANNSNGLNEFYEELAFETALMPLDTVANEYWHYLQPYDPIGYDGYGQDQVRIIDKRGYLGEYSFSYAMNVSHKVYVGATFGIHSVRYYEDIFHTETEVNDLEPDLYSFQFGEFNTTRGTGYAFKIGVVVKPIHILRIGASFHAPTIYRLTEEKFTELDVEWNSSTGYPDDYASAGVYEKDYTLRTPYRASASAALLIGKLGMVSAEYEYVDYSTSDLDSPGYKFLDENMAISQDFRDAHNLKAGAELRLNPLYLRAGLQYYMNPFVDSRNGSDIMVYSGGIGFRTSQAYVDISYSLRSSSELYSLYQHREYIDAVTEEITPSYARSFNEYKAGNLMVTLGYKF